ELQPERDLAHTPLFQVMIVLDTPLSEIDLHELQVRQIELTPAAPKFDLILFLRQRGEELVASWEYSTARFDGESIRRMAESFVTLLQSATIDPEQRIADLELLTTAEQRRLLVEWNDTHANCNQELCLHELFEAQVTRTPEAVALVAGTERITYAELNDRANRVTGELRALGVGPESLVGVLMERSSWLIVSLLGVLKAGGAYVPLDPTYPRERLRLMIEDADLKVILTCSGDSIEVTTTDDTDHSRGSNPDFIPSARNLAYLIYTSGSTGKPKGTAIEHHSAVTFMHWARDFFNESELSGVLASTSVCFDLSVFEIFVPLTTGGKIILAANALELPTLNAANEVTLINTVPSAMTELIRMRGVPASVKVVNLAGEPLHKPLAQRVYEVPNIERLLNLYGPSEDTTYSTWAWIDKNDTQPPTIGRPIANTQAYVLDAQLRSVPIGVIGELYLSGDGLARGYLNKPALTAEKFVPDPFSAVPGARMYRTGDLARYLSDARIEFLGRMDHQVKLRGFRIELGEIETLLGQHPAVQSAVVIARDHGEEKSLAAYFVPTPGQTVTQNDLREFLLERLPKYMVPAFLIELAELPLTPNGKIDRKALPAPEDIDVEREDVVVLPRTHVEAAVASLWSQLLNRHDISIHDDFFALGGHSLLAAQLVSRLREQFHVDLPLRSVFETPNVAALAKLIQNSAAESSPILPIARTESLPVSFAQQRLWLLDQIATSAYNITGGMRLQGELDRSAFTKALNAITGRHEILRTSFTLVDGRPVPVIAGKQPADVSFSDLSLLSADEREAKVRELADAQLRQSFDLTRGPLLRVTLLQLSNDEHVALVTMHHLVADGWSLNIFVKEFAAFYESFRSGASPDLPELRIQYADYAHWQRERLRHEVLENQLDYWRRTLSGSLPVLQLPVDNAGDSESK
ncbi:MAG TPA: amino acid adenylation domain-containing protein, partial [Pyrinomonadaceae bacterium]|nr:amino acid adenylation domain-containing protein [Pyrinomonadaceae bacterium]